MCCCVAGDEPGANGIFVHSGRERTYANDQMPARKIVFVDVFAGCGGLSLGLFQAGLHGLFAVEKDEFAFETLTYCCTPGNAGRTLSGSASNTPKAAD